MEGARIHSVYTRVKHVFITNHFCLFIYLLHNISDGKSKDTFCVYTCIYSYFYSYFYPNVFLYFIAECIDVSTHMFVYTCQHIAACIPSLSVQACQHICLFIRWLHNTYVYSYVYYTISAMEGARIHSVFRVYTIFHGGTTPL